jgi:hypothetical protein
MGVGQTLKGGKATPKNAAAIIRKIVKSYFFFGINNQENKTKHGAAYVTK